MINLVKKKELTGADLIEQKKEKAKKDEKQKREKIKREKINQRCEENKYPSWFV